MLNQKIEILERMVNSFPQTDFPLHSRVHPLNSFPPKCYVKREDELGFGISGSKIRKYRCLLPFLISNNIKEVILQGGANSNHVLSFSQLLIENKIKPILFLRGTPPEEAKGNYFYISLLVDSQSIHWISREEWQYREKVIENFIKNKEKEHLAILPEGATVYESFVGSLTLPLDILLNEIKIKKNFDHIFIDSGTGLTSSALILGMHWMEQPTLIHNILLAGNNTEYEERLNESLTYFEKLMERNISYPSNYCLYTPQNAKSYGSFNQKTLQEIHLLAREEGFLTDPIYSSKLFYESRKIIQEKKLTGNILLIHSGGAFSLPGFQPMIAPLIQR